jgi:hypothetical protein
MSIIKHSVKRFYLAVFILCAIAIGLCVHIYITDKSNAELYNLLIAVISLLIALFAFHISLKTYISIDSVNNISRMDGNIMENEGYRTNIVALINQFNQPKGEDAGQGLIVYINSLFAKKKDYSGIEFANNLQKLVDVLVLFPFFFKTDNPILSQNITSAVNKYIDDVEAKFRNLNQLSSGNLDILDETIKLIKAVLCHQQSMAKNSPSGASSIQQLRGTMLKNNLSRTIYYNYFGLYNLHKSIRHINAGLGVKSAWSIDTIANIHNKNFDLSNSEITTAIIYLEDAVASFNKALALMNEDLMWNAFIKYNLSRATFFLNILREDQEASWLPIIDQAINDRLRLNLLIKSIVGNEQNTYLQRAFIDQEKMARLMKLKLAIATNMPICKHGSESNKNYDWVLSESIMNETDNEFNRLTMRDEIANYITRL